MAPRFSLLLVLGFAAACAAPAPPPTSSPLPTPAITHGSPSTVPPTATPPVTPLASTPSTASPSTSTPTPTLPTTPVPATPEPTLATELTVSASEIERHLDALAAIAADNGGLRAAGLPGYDASAAYVAEQLRLLGYEVRTDPFDFMFFDEAAPVELVVGDASWSGAEWLHATLYSAPGEVFAPVQAVSMDGEFSTGTAGCVIEDWSGFSAGNIALIGSGPCPRRDQVVNAQVAGASAIISLYPRWESGQTRRPTLFVPDGITIPSIVAGQEPTLALVAAAISGDPVEIRVETILDERSDDNVLGELPGRTDRVIMLGGHLDSVLDGPGINDNGSGVATLLALAAGLRNMAQPEATIRFGFWGAEEFGDVGSQAYVAGLSSSERDRVDAYLNLDMVGSINAARLVYRNELSPPASYSLTDALLAAFDDLGAPAQAFDAGPSSDHFAFEQAGIAIGGVFSGLAPLSEEQAQMFGAQAGSPADPCYHLACDVRANVDTDTALLFGRAVAQVVQDLAF